MLLLLLLLPFCFFFYSVRKVDYSIGWFSLKLWHAHVLQCKHKICNERDRYSKSITFARPFRRSFSFDSVFGLLDILPCDSFFFSFFLFSSSVYAWLHFRNLVLFYFNSADNFVACPWSHARILPPCTCRIGISFTIKWYDLILFNFCSLPRLECLVSCFHCAYRGVSRSHTFLIFTFFMSKSMKKNHINTHKSHETMRFKFDSEQTNQKFFSSFKHWTNILPTNGLLFMYLTIGILNDVKNHFIWRLFFCFFSMWRLKMGNKERWTMIVVIVLIRGYVEIKGIPHHFDRQKVFEGNSFDFLLFSNVISLFQRQEPSLNLFLDRINFKLQNCKKCIHCACPQYSWKKEEKSWITVWWPISNSFAIRFLFVFTLTDRQSSQYCDFQSSHERKKRNFSNKVNDIQR